MGFVVDKAALGQVFSDNFVFPWQSSFHQFFSIIIITWGWHNTPLGGCSAEWIGLHPPLYQLKKSEIFTLDNPTYEW
jgi:hypothetical protein